MTKRLWPAVSAALVIAALYPACSKECDVDGDCADEGTGLVCRSGSCQSPQQQSGIDGGVDDCGCDPGWLWRSTVVLAIS